MFDCFLEEWKWRPLPRRSVKQLYGVDLVLQPVLLSAADASHPLARVQFNGERIDGRSSSQATLAFEKFVVDVSQVGWGCFVAESPGPQFGDGTRKKPPPPQRAGFWGGEAHCMW